MANLPSKAPMRFWLASLPTLLLALLVLAPAARAQTDDDDEGTAKPAQTAPIEPSAATPAQPGSAVTPPAATTPPGRPELAPRPKLAPPTVDQGYLEGRAEVESPNEAIHTIQKKGYKAANKLEVTLYPAAIQLNSKYTNSDGIAIGIDYALEENFALQVTGLWNYVGGWAPLNGTLLDLHARPLAADQIILQGGILGGFEVAPVYGKFAFYDRTLAQYRFVLNAGAGVGFTEVQLTGSTDLTQQDSLFGDTGIRFLGNLGAGFRVLLGERLALRLEVRDLLYTARVDHIDGCSAADLVLLTNSNGSAKPAGVSSSCNDGNFSNNKSNSLHASALSRASDLLQDNNSAVVNDILFFGGISLLF